MEKDYAVVEAEVEAYKAGYRDGGNQGYQQGRMAGMLEGIDYLIQHLETIRQELIGHEDKGDTPNADN